MRPSFLKKKPVQNEEMSLQITSMADIFIIILVFLLKSYSTGAINLTPAKGMLIPEANAAGAAVEALKLEVSETAIQIEGQPIANLEQFRFKANDLQGNGTSKALTAALEKERKRQLLIAKSNSEVKVDPKIIVVADKRAPYSTVKAVLASAAVNSYTDFKLAVIKGD